MLRTVYVWPPPSGVSRWAAALAQMRAAGADAGRAAAEWWGQDTVGGRASGDVRATARRRSMTPVHSMIGKPAG